MTRAARDVEGELVSRERVRAEIAEQASFNTTVVTMNALAAAVASYGLLADSKEVAEAVTVVMEGRR